MDSDEFVIRQDINEVCETNPLKREPWQIDLFSNTCQTNAVKLEPLEFDCFNEYATGSCQELSEEKFNTENLNTEDFDFSKVPDPLKIEPCEIDFLTKYCNSHNNETELREEKFDTKHLNPEYLDYSGCSQDLSDGGAALDQSKMALVNFLITIGIFVESIQCPKCAAVCKLNKETLYYQCWKRRTIKQNKKKAKTVKCQFRKSARVGTFFYGRIGLQRMAQVVRYFLELQYPRVRFMQRELNLSLTSVIDWSNYCREVCIKWADDNLSKLGGLGKIVEVDEATFGHRKYKRGRLVEGQWLFGGIERGSQRIFIVPVENRTAETLISIIKEWIEPGTTIISNCWKAYNRLVEEGFQLPTENHSYNFVDPDSGANTQSVEELWRDVREHIPKFGRKKSHFQGYISEYIFKRVNRPDEQFEKFLKTTKNMY